MKNIVAALLLTFGAGFCATAQVNLDSFYRVGATWTEALNTNYGQQHEEGTGYQYLIDKDSLMNGGNYHLLSYKSIGGFSTGYAQPGVLQTSYTTTQHDYGRAGALRIAGGKVFYINLDPSATRPTQPLNTEVLLYDFDLHVGDSLAWKPYNPVVQSIDTVQLSGGQYIRRYLFKYFGSTLMTDYWYEGTGSTLGLLNSSESFYPTNPQTSFYRFLCFKAGGYNLVTNPFGSQPLYANCYNVQQVLAVPGSPQAAGDEISIYPNPTATRTLSIESKGNHAIACVIVSDAAGRTVSTQNATAGQKVMKLHLNAAQGILFISVITDNGTRTVRRVVVE